MSNFTNIGNGGYVPFAGGYGNYGGGGSPTAGFSDNLRAQGNNDLSQISAHNLGNSADATIEQLNYLEDRADFNRAMTNEINLAADRLTHAKNAQSTLGSAAAA